MESEMASILVQGVGSEQKEKLQNSSKITKMYWIYYWISYEKNGIFEKHDFFYLRVQNQLKFEALLDEK